MFFGGGHFEMGHARSLKPVARGSGIVVKFEKCQKVESLAENNSGM